jgi:hypothetical protein
METSNFCQSCSMPLDKDEMLGTEKDGSKSHEYCKYCYADGSFVNPDMRLDQMTEIVKMQMSKMNIPQDVISKAVNILPQLKRWRGKAPVAF